MGCYDIIFLEVTCPYCSRTSLMELQTKDMDKIFETYNKDDEIKPEFKELKYLDVIGCCFSPECLEKADKLWIISQGCPSGFGLCINAKVKLQEGKITGELFDIEYDKDVDEKIDKEKEKWVKIYKPREKDSLVIKQFQEIIRT